MQRCRNQAKGVRQGQPSFSKRTAARPATNLIRCGRDFCAHRLRTGSVTFDPGTQQASNGPLQLRPGREGPVQPAEMPLGKSTLPPTL